MKSRRIITGLTVILIVLISRCSMPDNLVAEIGNSKITADDFKRLLEVTYPRQDPEKISVKDRRSTLDNEIAVRRFALQAKGIGLDKDPVYLAETQENEEKYLAYQHYNLNILPHILPDSLVRLYYDWQFINVRAAAIVVGYKGASFFNSDRSDAEALKLAEKYRATLAVSEKPEETAQKLTEDQRNTAVMNPYILGKFQHEINRAVITASVGETIGPLKTRRGYYVFRILAKTQTDPHTDYQSDRDRILLLVRRTFDTQERSRHQAITDSLGEVYNATANEEGAKQFMEVFSNWIAEGDHDPATFPREAGDIVLATADGQNYVGRDFIYQFNKRISQQAKVIDDHSKLVHWLEKNFLVQRVWALAARKAGVHLEPSVIFQIQRFNNNKLYQLYNQQVLREGISLSEDQLREYYDNNLDRFTSKEKIRIITLSSRDQQIANEVASRVQAGETMEELPKKYRAAGKKAPIYRVHGFVNRDYRMPELVTMAMDAGPQQIVGPILIEGTYYLIKTGQHYPQQVQSFAQARNSVHATLYNEARQQEEARLKKELEQKYPVKINESFFQEEG